MLKYDFKINTSKKNEEIKLNETYISSDLSFISGTVSSEYSLSENDVLWVDSEYFPSLKKVTVSSLDTVKRNGYILYTLPLEIKIAIFSGQDDEGLPFRYNVKYIEYNGNVYFQDMSISDYVKFNIGGVEYSLNPNDKTIGYKEKAYIEDDTVIISGITYGVVVGNGGKYTTFTDSVGNPFSSESDIWDCSNVTNACEYIQKVTIRNGNKYFIDTNNITYFGYQPYISYNDERYDLEIFTDSNFNNRNIFGVKINNKIYHYILDIDDITDDTEYEEEFNAKNFFSKEEFYPMYEDPYIEIEGTQCKIEFNPIEDNRCNNICIETSQEHLSIQIDDILILSAQEIGSSIDVYTDVNGVKYIVYNGRRYNSIANLCDYINMDGNLYQLTYDGDSTKPYLGMHAVSTLDSGDKVNFVVTEINNKTIVKVKKAKLNDDGEWVESMTMIQNGDDISYSGASDYYVTSRNGFIIDGVSTPIITIEKEYDDGVIDSYEIIDYSHTIEYKVRVIDTLGSNKIICEPYLIEQNFSQKDYNLYKSEIASYLVGSTCIVSKMSNTFGVIDFTIDNWLKNTVSASGPTSIWELSGVWNKIKLYRLRKFLNLPISLEKSINNDMCREDLIMDEYYEEMADEYVNKIIDMDKDIYSPYAIDQYKNITPIEKLQFNLHFRTRDMDNWSIYQDEGVYNDGDKDVELNINKDYCNWFCTDYWPYNQFSGDTEINNVMQTSDLLGLLYFTTDDVKRKAPKLKKSFLRLTYYDSIDPEKQNMLGTSTLYFDCNRHFDTIYNEKGSEIINDSLWKLYYMDVAKSKSNQRTTGVTSPYCFKSGESLPVGVLRDTFGVYAPNGFSDSGNIRIDLGDYLANKATKRLDSRIEVTDRYTTNSSSEGYYAYILKAFGDKLTTQTIYMKAEFFHAGLGIKIPMIIATDDNCNAIQGWTKEKVDKFKNGYHLKEVIKRTYIPIDISYSLKEKKFIYSISTKYGFLNAIQQDNTYVFNLFELKIKD